MFSQTDESGEAVDRLLEKIANSTKEGGEVIDAEELSRLIVEENTHILENQPEKIQKMELFAQQMSQWVIEYVDNEIASNQELQNNPEASQLLREKAMELVVESARAITYQDIKASAVTLGDHGWMHLTQDLRDSIAIAEGNRGADLSAKEKFMLGLAAAHHDIGYSAPEVSDPQVSGNGDYGTFDKGHPLYSYIYLIRDRKRLRAVLGREDADSLEQIVANHENPEQADRARGREDLSEAFAIADASAAFGIEKLPPVVVQIPEVLSYLNALATFDRNAGRLARAFGTQAEDGSYTLSDETRQMLWDDYYQEVVTPLKESAEQTVRDRLGDESVRDEEKHQMRAMLNSIKHFGPISLKFILGRMSAESTTPSVITTENGEKIVSFDIHAGFAREMEEKNIIDNTVKSASKLTIKLFLEQATITNLPDELQDTLIDCVASNSSSSVIDEATVQQLSTHGISVTDVQGSKGPGVSFRSGKVQVNSYGEAGISEENRSFYYDKIKDNLDVANQRFSNWITFNKTPAQSAG